MAGAIDTALVSEDISETEAATAGAVGLAVVLFALSLTLVFELVTVTDPVAGMPMVTFLGGLLVVLGLTVVAFDVDSRLGYVATDPGPTAGFLVSETFSLIQLVVGGLVASQILRFGTAGWIIASLITGGAMFAVNTPPRKDIGSTLPVGALAVFAGAIFLTSIIGLSWLWDLGWEQQASFNAELTIPILTAFCSPFIGWAAAKAYGGFGVRDCHIGAYILVYLNIISIIALLFFLVVLMTLKSLPGLLKGLASGAGTDPEVTLVGVTLSLPISWPFVMNGIAFLNDVDGALPAIVDTIWLVIGVVLLAVPLGIDMATFVAEYADRGRFTQVIEIATNGLWNTPDIVLGLFGLTFLIPWLGNQKSLLTGMLTLGFMPLPLVVITSRESTLAIPGEYHGTNAALGVTKWQTVQSIVLPAAPPGIVTGIVLGVGRTTGGTAPILPTMSGDIAPPGSQTVDALSGFQLQYAPSPATSLGLMQATSTFPYQLYSFITAGIGQSPNIGAIDEFRQATALILLAVVLGFYAVSIATWYHSRSELQHEQP